MKRSKLRNRLVILLVLALAALCQAADLSAASIVLITDKMSADWIYSLGTSGTNYGNGDGTFGSSLSNSQLATIVTNLGDITQQGVLAPIASSWPTPSTNAVIYKARYYRFSNGLDQLGQMANDQSSTITNLDSLMYWYNFGNGVTYWQCLAAPQWVSAYNAIHAVNPNPLNVYFVCTQGGSYGGTTFTNALAKFIVSGSVYTAGYTIPYTTYAGGLAYWNFTGGSGSGTVTVVGKDQQNNTETWTVNQTGASGNLLMTPSTHAYSLITKVSSVTDAAGAGTGYVEAHAPAGRTYPPT